MRYVIVLVFMACLPFPEAALKAQDKPNFILILADDQGYADLGCFGSKTIKTPNIDRMVREGQIQNLVQLRCTSECGRHELTPSLYPRLLGPIDPMMKQWAFVMLPRSTFLYPCQPRVQGAYGVHTEHKLLGGPAIGAIPAFLGVSQVDPRSARAPRAIWLIRPGFLPATETNILISI